jgi:hypothetical protein
VTGTLLPWVVRPVRLRIREFPGARVNLDAITYDSTCRFYKRPNTTFGTATRSADLTMEIGIEGWFWHRGNCTVRFSMQALSSNGTPVAPVQVSASFTVAAPTTYRVTAKRKGHDATHRQWLQQASVRTS